MINKATLIGNVGNDPEIKTFANGNKVANFSLATTDKWKDRSTGEMQSKTEWHKVAVFSEGLIGIVERYVTKGSKLYVEGKIQTRKWQDMSGNEKSMTEIVLKGFTGVITLLDSRENSFGSVGADRGGYAPVTKPVELNDEIPF